jgi:hypothetical protein
MKRAYCIDSARPALKPSRLDLTKTRRLRSAALITAATAAAARARLSALVLARSLGSLLVGRLLLAALVAHDALAFSIFRLRRIVLAMQILVPDAIFSGHDLCPFRSQRPRCYGKVPRLDETSRPVGTVGPTTRTQPMRTRRACQSAGCGAHRKSIADPVRSTTSALTNSMNGGPARRRTCRSPRARITFSSSAPWRRACAPRTSRSRLPACGS